MNKVVKTMLGKPTETADLRKWKFTDHSLTSEVLASDQTRTPEHCCQFGGLGSLWGLWQWNQYFSLVQK